MFQWLRFADALEGVSPGIFDKGVDALQGRFILLPFTVVLPGVTVPLLYTPVHAQSTSINSCSSRGRVPASRASSFFFRQLMLLSEQKGSGSAVISNGMRRSCSIFRQQIVSSVVRFIPMRWQMSSTFFFSCSSIRKLTFTLRAMINTSLMLSIITTIIDFVKIYHYNPLYFMHQGFVWIMVGSITIAVNQACPWLRC